MKKIFSIVFSIALLLGAVSCTDLLDPSLRQTGQQVPDDAKVTLYFATPADVVTKAPGDMASDPDITSIHVFVFNKDGILVETAEAKNAETGAATFGKVTQNGPDNAKHWSVILTMSGSERRLHFIANLPKDSNGKYLVPEAGSEASIFQSLATTYPAGAYWQRRVLTYGIKAYQYDGSGTYQYITEEEITIEDPNTQTNTTYYPGQIVTVAVPNQEEELGEGGSYKDPDGQTVNEGDYINRDGYKIIKGTGFYAIEEIVEKVPMIRNFAKIRVKSTWTRTVNGSTQTFNLTQAALINYPAAGYIAPYDPDQAADGYNHFVKEYVDITGAAVPVAANLGGYSVKIPSDGLLHTTVDDPPTGEEIKTAKDDDGFIVLYSYERGLPTSNPVTLLVAGKWNNSGNDIWYKIELTDQTGKYFKILRDFTYDVTITGIEGDEGHGSLEAALAAGPVGDFSNSPETATLERISDDNGLTLWVSYIDKPILNAEIPAAETAEGRYVTLLYTCFKGDNYFNDTAIDGDDEGHIRLTRQKHPDYATLPYATAGSDEIPEVMEGYPHVVTADDDVEVPDESFEWMIVKFKLNKIQEGQGYLRSQIHVEAKVTQEDVGYDKTLSRNVTYTVMPKQNFSSVSASGLKNGQTTLTIKLPSNLTPSIFPMDLVIEDENNCLMPVGNEPVESGKSTFTGRTNNYYFIKSIAYTDYYDVKNKQIKQDKYTVVLKTTRTVPTGGTKIHIYDKNGYFNVAEVTVN